MVIMETESELWKGNLDKIYPLIDQNELKIYSRLFCRELSAVLSNQISSLPAILNPICKVSPSPGYGIAISVGGTNGYASSFYISRKGVLKFHNRFLFPLPQNTTRDKLFHLVTKNALKVLNHPKNFPPIGIGLAYPLKPVLTHKYVDGELMYMTKGRNIEGLVGKRVGQEYHKFLKKEYGIDTTVLVANDAICLLLGGDGAEAAGVVGTGLNFAYWEKTYNIAPLKLKELAGFSQAEVAVNIESKNFNKIEGTKLRSIVDKESVDPGYSLAEKEAAGAYLFKIFNAGKKEILGNKFPDLSSSDQIDEIVTGSYTYPIETNEELQMKAQLFAQRILERSAQITAIELCGVLMKIGRTSGVVSIVMEGGIFWKAKNYLSLVNLYINTILPEVIPSFARLFGSSRRGIAVLARSVY